jgi:L-lactate dehydrogenase complex protein LldG
MSAARTAILAAVFGAPRAAGGGSGESSGGNAPGREAADARIAQPARHTRPAFDGDLAQRLHDKLVSHAATVERLATSAEVPPAVLRYLAARGLPYRLACAPALAALPWPQPAPGLHCGAARRDEVLAVTPCLAAVAELGSLVLVSGAESPTTLNFVPEHHLVVVRESQIVRHFEDAWQLLRARNAAGSGMPRAVNVISGPSRTADVEQTVQLGAHGPRHLHVMLVAAG